MIVPLAYALGLIAIAAPPPTAAWNQLLDPIGKWVLDYGETQCMAMRQFGNVADPTTFAIRPAPNGETYELLIGRMHGGPEFAEQLEGGVDFGTEPIKAWLLHFAAKKSKLAIYRFRISAEQMMQARTARAVTLHIKGKADSSFSLGAMPALLKGLENCTEDLKRYWNMNGEATGKVAIAAKPLKENIRSIFSDHDYPAEALDRFQEGKAQFLLLIDEKGKVAGCHIVNPSGIPALDAMGCQVLMERASFTPAKDASGKPVRSSTVTPPIIWKIDG